MFDKKIKNELRKKDFYSFQDSMENLLAFQGEKSTQVFERFHELVEFRGIPNTTVNKANISGQDYLIVTRKISPEVKAQVAVSADKYGKDMRLQIAFAHYDTKAFGKQQTIAAVLLAVGILFFWTGVGALALIGGIIMMVGAKNQFREDYKSERDNFFVTILGILSESCDEAGVDFDAKSNFP